MVRNFLAHEELYVHLIAIIAILLASRWPLFGNAFLTRIESIAARLAIHQSAVIFATALAVVAIRVALLPLIRIPYPMGHDEFSYLLAADTFAHGRLTNPTHPMWLFFDTLHVNQHPTYMSKYPPAQGAVLALGQLLGHPWIGVLLSTAAMCAAIAWMLYAWLPPRWAFLGSLLFILQIGLDSYWMNTYWGGSVAALAGALVAGALPRIRRHPRARDAILMAIGVALLANSRPFEGAIFCIPVAAALLVWLVARRRRDLPFSVKMSRVVAPLAAILALTAAFMLYYDWRVTGHPLLFPYSLNQKTYFSTPIFLFQNAQPPRQYLNPEFLAYYGVFERNMYEKMRHHPFGGERLSAMYEFFLRPALEFPLVLALPWLIRDRRIRFLLLQFALCFLAFFSTVWLEPHYVAAISGTLFVLVAQSMRHVRHWRHNSRPIGIGITRAVVTISAIMFCLHVAKSIVESKHADFAHSQWGIAQQIEQTPGYHLAIVRYAPDHIVHHEYVYNRADIDFSRVVWARDIPGVDLGPLLYYFRGRDVWVVEPDAEPVRLSKFQGTTPPNP
jgi:hypothetical protein